MPDQTGRTVVVTGANSGLGLASAEAFAGRGAAVVLACRDARRAETARARVATAATGPAPTVVSLDLADLASVRKAADEIADRCGRVDVLMNNAGVMAPPLQRTADGFEMQFGTNHLGHFALTGLLLPTLLRAAGRPGWTDLVADAAGRRPGTIPTPSRALRPVGGRARSKLANLLFMRELGRRAREAGCDLVSAAAHPGYAATDLPRPRPPHGGWLLAGGRSDGRGGGTLVAQPAAAGALPQLYAATMPEVGSGDYFGPRGPRCGCAGARPPVS